MTKEEWDRLRDVIADWANAVGISFDDTAALDDALEDAFPEMKDK